MFELFYSPSWHGEVPSDTLEITDDNRWSWSEHQKDDQTLWVETPPLIHPSAFEEIATRLKITPANVADIARGVAVWDDGATYLEPVPGVTLDVPVSQWDYQRQMWAIFVAHADDVPADHQEVAHKILSDSDPNDPIGLHTLVNTLGDEPDFATGPTAIFDALGDSTGLVKAVPIPPPSARPNIEREGGVWIENPVNLLISRFVQTLGYDVDVHVQNSLGPLFSFYGYPVPQTAFGEIRPGISDSGFEKDDGDEDSVWFGTGELDGDPYDDTIDPQRVQGIAFVNDTVWAIDFKFVTFLVSTDGTIQHSFPSFGARLMTCCDARTLTFDGEGWETLQYDIEERSWRYEAAELPRAGFIEVGECSFLYDRDSGETIGMSTVYDYPKTRAISPCGRFIGAWDRELSGSVYRHDGEEQFWIGQPHDMPYDDDDFDIETGKTMVHRDLDDDATDAEYERWEAEQVKLYEYGSHEFAFVLATDGWRFVHSGGYRTRMSYRVQFLPCASAMAFSNSGDTLLLAGRGLSHLKCDLESLTLIDFFNFADLNFLGRQFENEEVELKAALKRYGTLAAVPSFEALKKIPVRVDYETHRLMSHAEATRVWELAKQCRAPVVRLFGTVAGEDSSTD